MKPARNTRRSPANWPPPKLAGSNFVARTTTPKRPIRIPATFSRDTVSPKKRTMRIAMNTMFTLTRRAVFDAVVRRMPSFWRSKPIAFTAPRIHTIGSRKMRRSRRRIAARTSSPRMAPRAIRAKVRNSGSTLSTVSLLPGNEVPQRTLARRIKPTSRPREAIGRPEEAMGHMRFAAERPRRPGGLYDPAGRLPRADGRGAASPRLRDHPDRGRDRRIRLPSDSTAAGRRDARGGHRARALHPRVFRPSARGRRPGRPRRGLPDVHDRAVLRHPGLSETRGMAVPARDFRGGRVVPRRTGARPRVRLGVPARDLPRLILTSTSTTLSLKLLADSGYGAVRGADLITASILIDDIVALSLMTFVVGLASPSPLPPLYVLAGLLGVLGLATFLVFVGSHALPPVLRATDSVSPSSVIMVALSFGLLISFAFAVLGLPPLVGAFFAGSIVASTEYGPRVSRHITPVAAVFMGVFFASIGFLINPSTVPGVLLLSLAATGVAAAAKFVPGLLILPRAAGVRAEAVWPLAAFLIPRAEISLIIAQYGVTIGITPDLLPIAMAVMIRTAVLPTPIGEWAKRRAAAQEPAQTDPT